MLQIILYILLLREMTQDKTIDKTNIDFFITIFSREPSHKMVIWK